MLCSNHNKSCPSRQPRGMTTGHSPKGPSGSLQIHVTNTTEHHSNKGLSTTPLRLNVKVLLTTA